MTWDDFSNLVAGELDLELDQRVNSMGPDGVEPDHPFSKLDATIAVRAYLRNSTSNPESAAEIFFQSIHRFSDPDAKDLRLWDWAAHNRCKKPLNRKQGDEGARLTIMDHTDDANPCSLSPSSNTQPTPPTKAMQSNMEVDDAEAASRGNSPDDIVMDSEQSAEQRSLIPVSKTMIPSPHGLVHSDAGENQGDQLTTPQNTPPEHTSDDIFEYQDCSQFAAKHQEMAVQETLRTLHPGRADMKTLHALLKALHGEEALTTRVDVASMD
ncbi:hypothetical protein DFJ58DRAFT_846452 [Suillus subalutaceus]|uniref:uncharacterized protein n=1 Tax=Suillus subalutaceus TaxID=48586 RepID=UPI001B875687|nr:uncharacterized protein DFJ58DRAFT_846452 [Suillus subalutaceus]KAG1837442.1 hypothetical protein DFJ58DRAFT_846452 [Suillus subalutaceus]